MLRFHLHQYSCNNNKHVLYILFCWQSFLPLRESMPSLRPAEVFLEGVEKSLSVLEIECHIDNGAQYGVDPYKSIAWHMSLKLNILLKINALYF